MDLKNVETLCKVCLGTDETVYDLEDKLRDDGPRICEALEYVTSQKADFTTGLCETCLKSLTIAYDFKKQYESSSNVFNNLLDGKNWDESLDVETIKIEIEDDKLDEVQYKTHVHNRGSKQYSCKVCNIVCDTKSALGYHTMKQHEEKKFKCETCQKTFYRKSFLNRHLEHHTKDIVKTICTVCGKQFHYRGSLFYHMKMHNKILNYKCRYCDKSYYSRSCLKQHEVTHTRVRSYKCSECNKMFFSSSDLKRHTYVHSDNKPYECEYCGKGFATRYNLKTHLETYSGDFPCRSCNKSFVTKEILTFHHQRKHKMPVKDVEELEIDLER